MKRKLGALEKVEADLPNLQNKIRRDPQSYKDDFFNQYQQYNSFLSLFLHAPTHSDEKSTESLRDLIDFVAHLADCYPTLCAEFPKELATLLHKHHAALDPELRDKVVGSLVLLRKKGIIDCASLLTTLFPILVETTSKSLRALIFQKIISELRAANSKTTNHKLNRSVQILLHNLISTEPASPKGLWAVKITRELWRRQVWADAKAVDIMKEAALSQNEKVVVGGVQFFLGGDQDREEAAEESDADDGIDIAKLRHQQGINKKSKKAAADLKRAAASVRKKDKKKKAPHPLNFSALHLLHDPQGFAERLFQQHLQTQTPKVRLNLEHRLLVLQLVSRLVGLHQLTLIQLYSYVQKYLTPRQHSVTSFLASLAQATHALVPPDVIEPLVQKIANEFVSEASAGEVASAGLNAIREICTRQPLAMNETLLQDLVTYKKSKDKGVMMAAKGLLGLYRDVGADLLKKRDRGKAAAMAVSAGERKEQRFGELEEGQIEGIELLEAWKEEERRRKREEQGLDPDEMDDPAVVEEEEEEGWNNWNVEDDESDDSGGWINVESDGEDIVISDSEDEGKAAKPADGSTPRSVTGEPEVKKQKLSTLATSRILTPADLAKLQELRATAAVTNALPSHRTQRGKAAQISTTRHVDDPLTAAEIEGLASLSKKATKDEKVALAKGDREQKHSSTTAIRKEKKAAEGKSTTNKEKARKKNFLMTLGKAKRKGKRSLVEQRKILKGHVARQKSGGRRGNK